VPPPTVAVHWVASGGAPSPAAERSLAAWAEARGVRLSAPTASPAVAIKPDLAIGDAVEDDLSRARDAITSQDAAAADAALARAEELLRAHPELPQASWLLAEVLREGAVRSRQLAPHDATRAALAWNRAASLDRGRAAGVGEVTGDAATTSALATLSIAGLAADEAAKARVTVDGVSTTTLASATGDHQVRVTIEGALVWAGWVRVAAGHDRAVVTLPRAAPCSQEDLSRAGLRATPSASGVACGDWVHVDDDASDAGLGIARCSGDACGPVVRWKVGPPGPVVPESRGHETRWPVWGTAAIVTAGVVVVAVATLAATGVFRPTHDQAVFTTGGLHVAATPLDLVP
jgi:hypothetical protein